VKAPKPHQVVIAAAVAVLYGWWPLADGNPLVFCLGWGLAIGGAVTSGPPGPDDGSKKEH
jgi:hypothetical protein